ncbi:hypothetical protein Y032_0152g2885 [Ancylostoma ceylanicum]|uniref:Uncharacterized protein n=1 Tax=Ancylostoma ceylanicum TaxID=53326 RepID=A0A016T0Z9_9BILA|nr:hypothetical protein Y032_0152g2885 [Ancylostoma ceylanicum]
MLVGVLMLMILIETLGFCSKRRQRAGKIRILRDKKQPSVASKKASVQSSKSSETKKEERKPKTKRKRTPAKKEADNVEIHLPEPKEEENQETDLLSVQDDPKNPLLDPKVRALLLGKKTPVKSKEPDKTQRFSASRMDIVSRLPFHKAKHESARIRRSVTASESQALRREDSERKHEKAGAKAGASEKGSDASAKQPPMKSIFMRVTSLRRRKPSKDAGFKKDARRRPSRDNLSMGKRQGSKEVDPTAYERLSVMPAPVAKEPDKIEEPEPEVKEEAIPA